MIETMTIKQLAAELAKERNDEKGYHVFIKDGYGDLHPVERLELLGEPVKQLHICTYEIDYGEKADEPLETPELTEVFDL